MSKKKYSYASSIKSGTSDELVNTYLIRPLAGILVRLIFRTPISPNQITAASIAVGSVAALLYADGTAAHNIAAGLCIFAKDILDSADGQLARAKQQFSRNGRFLDSIGDILVNLLSFVAISLALYAPSGSPQILVLGFLAFAGLTLRISYHVFYHTSYLHLHETYTGNRLTEEIQLKDREQSSVTLHLQSVFQVLYGWQDRLMVMIDGWCREGLVVNESNDARWYGDMTALRISGLIGLGTELFVLMIFSLTNQLYDYLLFNCFVMNAVWIGSVFYRRVVLRGKIMNERSSARP